MRERWMWISFLITSDQKKIEEDWEKEMKKFIIFLRMTKSTTTYSSAIFRVFYSLSSTLSPCLRYTYFFCFSRIILKIFLTRNLVCIYIRWKLISSQWCMHNTEECLHLAIRPRWENEEEKNCIELRYIFSSSLTQWDGLVCSTNSLQFQIWSPSLHLYCRQIREEFCSHVLRFTGFCLNSYLCACIYTFIPSRGFRCAYKSVSFHGKMICDCQQYSER